ncbi:MAG: GGDEF domain-containing protein [Clostridia bacterium]
MLFRWIGTLIGAVLSVFWMLIAWATSQQVNVLAMVVVLSVMQIGFGYWLGKKFEHLQSMAHHDSLTGLLSHRRFLELLGKEIDRAKRHCYPVTMMFIDLDNFKKYNDSFGHPEGDKLLFHFGQVLQKTVRTHDEVGRWGGEEFVILLPHTDTQQAMLVGERLRKSVRNELGGVTASIGIATFPSHANSAAELAAQADTLMYEAKQTKDCMIAGS